MKIMLFYLLLAFLTVGLSSCYTHRSGRGHVPPGQAKKIHGNKSAKKHAPGQQKKRSNKRKSLLRSEIYYYSN